jgi:hypothetical protein
MNKINDNSGSRPGYSLVGGLFILLGVVFLIGQFFDIRIGQYVWPFFIMGPGALLFLTSLAVDKDSGQALASVGGIVSMVGLILFVQNVTDLWATWAYAWALIAPTGVGLGLFSYGLLKNETDTRRSGWQLIKAGLGIFVVAAIFFELVIGLSGFGLGQFGWPLLLIALGVFLLLRNLFTGQDKDTDQSEPSNKETKGVYDNAS